MEKATEQNCYVNILGMVSSEVEILAGLDKLSHDDLKRLEILTKIYSNLKDDLRQDAKYGLVAPPAA